MNGLSTRALACRRGDRTVLQKVDLAFAAGAVTAIVGPNGSGKTTLLRHLAGLETPASGDVLLDDLPLSRLGAGQRARRIAFLPQSVQAYWPLPGRDLVALGRLPYGADLARPLAADDAAAVERALARVDARTLADRPIDTLSQGERARLMLARVLATEAGVLLADEPVASLDPAYALDTMAILRSEAARGGTVVVSLHDLGLAARFADRVVVLAGGRVAADGPPAIALQPAIIEEAYGVGFRTLTVEGQSVPLAWGRRS